MTWIDIWLDTPDNERLSVDMSIIRSSTDVRLLINLMKRMKYKWGKEKSNNTVVTI